VATEAATAAAVAITPEAKTPEATMPEADLPVPLQEGGNVAGMAGGKGQRVGK
jgi:hypothetical protein